ncbi:hypothetical protein GJ744_002604 [Endocarpon pusillum]|uniref:Zn(2)-C6 fungal-type domain-containing protein n=1 Tax=Endocarpon pusillum TaxID=364733 RepID=A0A8H7AFE2_9EURO|nr:hypothetical protein GJ744_002604 [Endocarpon pusillum]
MDDNQGMRKRRATSTETGTPGPRTNAPKSTTTSNTNANKQACVACRQRKIRCDAQRPCAYCISKKKDCVYGPAFRRAQCAQAVIATQSHQHHIVRHVDALENIIRELERTKSKRLPSTSKSSPSSADSIRQEGRTDGRENDVDANTGTSDTVNSRASSSHGARKRYGKSSSLHFALKVKASATAMAEGSDHQQSPLPETGDVEDAEDGEEEWTVDFTGLSPGMAQLLLYCHVAKVLFDVYFEAIHPIWPFLLEHESRQLFSDTWTSDLPPNPLWMVQLNLIMSLAASITKARAMVSAFMALRRRVQAKVSTSVRRATSTQTLSR